MEPQDQQQERINRDKEQERFARRFVTVPFEVMLDERLTLADKFVYGRALGFYEFFESAEKTAAFIGISADQARKSKQKLEKLGLIKCFLDDGRGKRYIAELDPRKMKLSTERQRRLEENPNAISKKNQSHYENQPPENKTENKAESKDILLKDKSFNKAQAPEDETDDEQLKEDESPKRYGNADINEILDLWEGATGFSHHSEKRERFAANNLLRKYGLEATKALIRRVEVARRSDDQFAPQIAKPSQLMGKYEKLTALKMWEERTAKREEAERANSNTPDFRKLYANPDAPHYYHDCRPSTPEEKAEVHRKAEEIKKKLDWYVPKDQRKEGC